MAKKEKVSFLFFNLAALVFVGIIITTASQLFADTQKAGPVILNLPTGWACKAQGANYICLDSTATGGRNAAIVVSYKQRSAEDSLDVYRDQLSRPRTLYQGDLAIPSQPKSNSDRTINSIVWIEGIHLGSELANYYTHYYATVASNNAILISITLDKNDYQRLLGILKPTIDTLSLSLTQSDADRAGGSSFGGLNLSQLTSGETIEIAGQRIPKKLLYIVTAGIAVLALLLYAILS